jgi:uncharacterized protein YqgV (UPF0045/DUF77 family)
VSISPLGEGVGVSAFVAEATRVLRSQERVRYELGPMFTTLEGDLDEILALVTLEGDLDEILALVRQMQEAVFAAGVQRVSTVLKIDDRRDRKASMREKVRAVEEKLA